MSTGTASATAGSPHVTSTFRHAMIWPAVLVILLVGLFPVIYTLVTGFQNINMFDEDTGFSGLLRAQAPEDALLVRLGGEEFGVLFSSGSPERARLFAERMVTLARITPFDTPAGQLFITVSGGVSFGSASMSADDLVGSADSALYRAKSTGRDRICEAEICAAA